MRVLLDTHAFLWHIQGSFQESEACRRVLNSDADVLVSIASCWEIAIKVSTGKLLIEQPLAPYLTDQLRFNEFDLLPIELSHAAMVRSLPFHHRDPFDRLLVAQALSEGVPIVSRDEALDLYGIERIW